MYRILRYSLYSIYLNNTYMYIGIHICIYSIYILYIVYMYIVYYSLLDYNYYLNFSCSGKVLYPTLCNPMEATRLLCPWSFPRQGYCSGFPFPSPGNISDPGMEPACPPWQANSLPLSHQGSRRGKVGIALQK